MRRCLIVAACVLSLMGFTVAQVPQAQHVFVVVEHGHSYASVINSSSMPYLNSLASQHGLATQYYANAHPAIGDMFTLTTGQVITNDENFSGTVSQDNIVRHLLQAGKTWKSYAESLPYAGYTGGDEFPYLKRQNPFAYFQDVANSSEKLNLVPFTQFSADLVNGALPNVSFIVPNANNSMRACPAGMNTCSDAQKQANADKWLKTNIAPLLASETFKEDGLLIILFDESFPGDTASGGGRVAAVLVGPKVKRGYKSTNLYGHKNVLKTLLRAAGADSYPAAVSNAATMKDFFVSPTTTTTTTTSSAATTATTAVYATTATTTGGVTVTSPAPNAIVASPVTFKASATGGGYPITALRIYVDYVSKYSTSASSLSTSLSLPTGPHNITVQAWNLQGTVYKKTFNITVSSSTSPTTTTTPLVPSTTYHLWVSTSGSDSNDGSQSRPFRTIQKAANVANPNTTIHVLSGTYTQSVTMSRSGTSSGRIVFKSENKWGAKIVGSGASYAFRIASGVQYIDIVDFAMTGNSSTSYASSGILIYGARNRAIGNHIYGFRTPSTVADGSGVGVHVVWSGQTSATRTYNEVINNVIHDVWSIDSTKKVGTCVYIGDQRNKVINNLVYNCGAYGIQMNHYTGYNTIANNTVGNIPHDAGIMMAVGGDSAYSITSDYNVVANNVVVDSRAGITAWEGSYSRFGTHNVWANNLTYNNGSNTSAGNVSSFSSKIVQSGDLHSNPNFVSKSYSSTYNGNFRLQYGSPAINRASSSYSPTLDMDYIARPQGGASDTGAYEYH